jgi:hypothetical protein
MWTLRGSFFAQPVTSHAQTKRDRSCEVVIMLCSEKRYSSYLARDVRIERLHARMLSGQMKSLHH